MKPRRLLLPAALLACAPCNPTFASGPATPPGATATTREFASSSIQPILDQQSNTSRIRVTGFQGYLWDVDVHLDLQHAAKHQLDIRLTSPAGRTVVLSTRNAIGADDPLAFVFDDQSVHLVTDVVLGQGIADLAPEGALFPFTGEDPNGWWTLDVADGELGDEGAFSWGLDLVAIDRVPQGETSGGFMDSTPRAIPDGGTLDVPIMPSPFNGFLSKVEVFASITHQHSGDLSISLIGPSGRTVHLSTNSGGDQPDFFSDVRFSDLATQPVSDAPPTASVAAVIPEGKLAALIDEDFDGTWTLQVTDSHTPYSGTLQSWTLVLTVTSFVQPVQIVCEGFGGCSCGNDGHAGNGCANAFHGGGASLRAELENGVARLTDQRDELLANDLQPFSWCLFLQGGDDVPSAPFGDGLLCIAQNIVRLGVKPTFLGGADYPGLFDVPLARRASPGEVVYQALYRTPSSWGPCGASGGGVNTTNAIRIQWLP